MPHPYMRFMPDRFKPSAFADIPVRRCKNATDMSVLNAPRSVA